MKHTVLVLDDDLTIQKVLGEDLPSYQFEILACTTCEEARRILHEKPLHAMILDYRLPDGTGADFFRSIQKDFSNVPAIFITSYPNIEQAVDLIKEGASDYIIKPFLVADVAKRLHRAIGMESLQAEVHYHRRRQLPAPGKYDLVGSSVAMQAVRRAIAEVIRSPTVPVLITGETGTGKEIVARLIHQGSCGEFKSFIEVDCTTIPEPLFESELFGHEKGAFTNADRAKEGIFELAKEGTIFLDEIGEMDSALQGRLLRVIESRQFRRLGGTRPLTFGARIMAATNRDIQKLMNEKIFRADLYFRLAVYEIFIPPLRERLEDVPELAEHFLREAAARYGKTIRSLSPNFLNRIKSHSFPGNVRELRNLVEQAVIQTETEEADLIEHTTPIHRLSLPSSPSIPLTQQTTATTLSEQERRMIDDALQGSHGNKSAAARQLGISRPALLRRMAKLTSQPS